ncbi:DUF4440 domain-containing protein [Kineococcus xinjiangensis]|uniref:nuclear transport factor 2 family protein n=1 Tax=Kineococcus xinjiangensis TaxID=512762 RepID=UPI00130485CD|nr:DUF4440 domain-containing protein [Kineococcus xinjiangensis]
MDDTELVIGLERALLSSATRRNRQEVDRLLDEDFEEIGASGRLWSRSEMMHALAAEPPGDDRVIPDAEMRACVLSADLILLTYVSDPDGRRAHRSSLWRRTATGWRLRHHQGTLTGMPGQER